MINTDEIKIKEILSRGVEEIFDPKKEGQMTFREKLEAKQKGTYKDDIIIKFGIDPTKPDLHLGHAVILRTLRKLQDIGCKIVFLVGDFTAQIGDPTGKSKVRPEIQQREAEKNMRTYLEQVGRVLKTGDVMVDSNYFSWIRNSDWFVGVEDITPEPNKQIFIAERTILGIPMKITAPSESFLGKAKVYGDSRMQKTYLKMENNIQGVTLINLMSALRGITFSQLITRDMFQDRIKKGDELHMHEMLYPVFQAIDSVIISKLYKSCDLEIGGTDQTFNMLMGRQVMKYTSISEQAVISMKILRGTDGKNKMSKSLDNYISITDSPENMFGKIMSIPDELIKEYLELCTDLSNGDIGKIVKMANPRDQKIVLAKEIIKIYYNTGEAENAEAEFKKVFSNKELPSEMPIFKTDKAMYLILDLLVDAKLAESKNDAKRVIEGGGVHTEIGGQKKKIEDWKAEISVEDGMVVQFGKRKFVKIKLQ